MLKYSTSDRTVKLIDTERWISAPAWKQIRSKPDVPDDDTPPKLGAKHPDGKVRRRQSVR